MRLMRIPESIEARSFYLFHPCADLRSAKSMALPQPVFVLGNAVEKNRFAIQQEGMVPPTGCIWPVYTPDTIRSSHPVDELSFFGQLSNQGVQVRMIRR